MKVNRIKDYDVKKVLGQEGRCYLAGRPVTYQGDDCLNDCTSVNKPRYYISTSH